MNYFTLLRKNHPNFFLIMLGNIAVYLSVGLGFALGPARWHNGANYAIIDRFIPMEIWGVLLMIVGIVMIIGLAGSRWRVVQSAMYGGIGITTVFTIGFIAVAFTGSLAGLAGPALWGYFLISQLAQADEPPCNPLSSKDSGLVDALNDIDAAKKSIQNNR